MNPSYSAPIRNLLNSTVGTAADLMLPAVKKFVILTSGRSGSNLLMSLLKSHPKVTLHGEIVGEYQLESRKVRRLVNQTGPCGYLDRRLNRMTTEAAAGVKILYHQFEARYGQVRGIPGTEALLDHILSQPDVLVVHLVREDKLAQLISLRLAGELAQWTSGDYGERTVALDEDWVRTQFEYLEEWERRIPTETPADRLIEMTYETLVADMDGELKRLFAFLGMEPIPTDTHMSKQNKRPKSEVVENYEELRAAFAGTRFATYFDYDETPAAR